MRPLTFLILLLTLLGLLACQPRSDATPAVTLTSCQLAGGQAAECGTLTVPENRGQENGRTITLNLAVIRARDSIPDPTPLIYIPGGPGQAAVATYPLLASAFERINRKHDILLVDQRGTGRSNGLECADLPAEVDLTLPDDDALRDEARQCYLALSATADLTQYTTAVAVADLDAVRAALGYEQVNLYGGSYGTRVALAYMRVYPERVRAVILDGVVPPDYTLLLETPQDGQRALQLLFDRCAADPFCRAAFPDLPDQVTQLLDRLAAGPVAVTLPDPATGEPRTINVDRATFPTILFNLSYSPELVSLLPLLIDEAAETGDLAPLVVQSLLLSAGSELSAGMFFAVACSEDAPFIDPAAADAISEGTIFRTMARSLVTACAEWPAGAIPPDFREPLPAAAAEKPVLLLSGEADPVTPPRYAERAAAMLPNSRHLVAPQMGHIIIDRGCLPRLAADFVGAASFDGLDLECVADIAPPPFFINRLGPHP